MKKMTFIAALLGVTQFSNAQVGIGTATPADAAQLEISATNKGVLIPRVRLTDITVFTPVDGTPVESLLVYNIGTTTGLNSVSPGFYYWVPLKETVAAHWERIVNQTQLNEAIENITDLQGDVTKIIELLKVAFPSNNLVDPSINGDTHGGGMVFIPGVTPTIEYVYFDGTNYVKKDITSDIINLIKGNETKTKVVTIQNKQFYLAEDFTGTVPATIPATLPTGMYAIDVVGGVIKNIEEIFTTNTTIVINEGETNEQTFTTVQEYIEYISQNSLVDGVTKIIIDATTNQASFQRWNKATNTWVNVANSAFEMIVTDNETKTTIGKSTDNSAYTQVTADPKAAQKIVYEYLTESVTVKNYIDVTADVEWSIENNTDVKNAIEEIINNLLNQGGNVYFTRTEIVAGTPAGQLAIPAFSFYTVNASTGVKELVDIAQTIVNAITNATTVQKQEIKNQLGDKINNISVVKTGDTFNGGDVYIYTNTTTIAANTAVTSGITIPAGIVPGTIIGIKVMNAKGISSNVTDVVITGQNIDFNIGTGNMYNILGAGTYDVIVEFTE